MAAYRQRFPDDTILIDEVLGDAAPTVTMVQRDLGEMEAGLLFGLLALANALIAPETLTRVLDAWVDAPGRSLRELLVERGYLDASDASMIAVLAEKHLARHDGIARSSLIALASSVRFQFDPEKIVDPELRAILTRFIADKACSCPTNGAGTSGFDQRYKILEKHREGGLGIISRAHDREINREVAVKEIKPKYADDPDSRERFLREAEVTGRLEHPGIVPVYGMGNHPDGRPYYIMRFIRGETLEVAINRLHKLEAVDGEAATGESLDLHALVGRFIDACHAVAHAHDRKVLHRDIKPINIMLGPFGETLVVDWGIARNFEGPRSDEAAIEEDTLRPESGSEMTPTRHGSMVGTIGHVSPEQAAGRHNELRPTSDIYSLGITLYFLATGRAPFGRIGLEEFRGRVSVGDFPRPTEVNPSVPLALEAICLKAMALRPIDRYQTAGELAEDLERWRAGQPVNAYPEPFLDRAARKAKKHKTSLAGAAVLLVCTTVGSALFAERKREENVKLAAERAVAERERAVAERAKMHARNSLKMSLKELSGPDFTYLPNSGPVRLALAQKVLKGYRELKSEHPNDQEVRSDFAYAAWITANICRSMGEFFDEGLRLYREAMRLLETPIGGGPSSDEDQLLLANVRIDLGEHYRMAGRPNEAEPWYRKALKLLAEPGFPTVAEVCPRIEASALIDLAASLVETGQYKDALPYAKKAVEILRKPSDKPPSDYKDRLLRIYALNNRSIALLNTGERDLARTDMTEALGLAQELLAEPANKANTDIRYVLAITHSEFGKFLGKVGEQADAANQFDTAFGVIETLWRENLRVPYMEAEMAAALNGRAGARLSGKPDAETLKQAKDDCLKAHTILDKMVDQWREHPAYQSLLAQTDANLGRIALAEGDREGARRLLNEASVQNRIALKSNPASPEDKILRETLDREIEALKAMPGTAAPGR